VASVWRLLIGPPRWHYRAAINGLGAAVPLRVLHTEYASVAEPIVAFIDRLREHHDKQVVVLDPVALPDRLRYEFLHNHFDLVLTAALRARPDVVSARIPIPLHVTDGEDPVSGR
jgi:hypothetical protein